MCHASLCCLVYVSLSMNSLLSATRGASALFLIAGAKVRTFPLPAKHSDDFFQGGNTNGHARRWGRTPWGKKKNPGGKRAGNGRRNGRGAAAEGTPYYYGARKGQTGRAGRREGRLRGRRAPRRAGEARGPREKDGRRPAKKRPRGKREFPSSRSHFFLKQKNVKRPRKTKALLGTTYYAGNHENRIPSGFGNFSDMTGTREKKES